MEKINSKVTKNIHSHQYNELIIMDMFRSVDIFVITYHSLFKHNAEGVGQLFGTLN